MRINETAVQNYILLKPSADKNPCLVGNKHNESIAVKTVGDVVQPDSSRTSKKSLLKMPVLGSDG